MDSGIGAEGGVQKPSAEGCRPPSGSEVTYCSHTKPLRQVDWPPSLESAHFCTQRFGSFSVKPMQSAPPSLEHSAFPTQPSLLQ
jgi:hypothetical protein